MKELNRRLEELYSKQELGWFAESVCWVVNFRLRLEGKTPTRRNIREHISSLDPLVGLSGLHRDAAAFRDIRAIKEAKGAPLSLKRVTYLRDKKTSVNKAHKKLIDEYRPSDIDHRELVGDLIFREDLWSLSVPQEQVVDEAKTRETAF